MLNELKYPLLFTNIHGLIVKNTIVGVILIFVLVFLVTGCYTTTRGEFIGTSKKTEFREIKAVYPKVVVESRPTINYPVLTVRVFEVPEYKIPVVDQYTEHRKPNKRGSFISMLVGLGMMYGATAVDTTKSGGKDLQMGIFFGGVAFVLPAMYTVNLPSEPEETGNIIEEDAGYKNEEGTRRPLERTRISASIGNKSKNYLSNRNGLVRINLVNDFDLFTFESPQNVRVRITSEDPILDHGVTINSSEWTVPFIKINARRGWLFEEPSATSNRLMEYTYADTGRIIDDNDPHWLQVELNGTIGWLPAQVGTKYWSILR